MIELFVGIFVQTIIILINGRTADQKEDINLIFLEREENYTDQTMDGSE